MNASQKNTHTRLASEIWEVCNLLRGYYKAGEYRKVVLPLVVLRRFDCVLSNTKDDVLRAVEAGANPNTPFGQAELRQISGLPFYCVSPLDFDALRTDPGHAASALRQYIAGYSAEVRDIMSRFSFDDQIEKMDQKDLLFGVIQLFANIDLSPDVVDNMQMGRVFEELIRIGAEQSNEEAGEHFTPVEVIRLMTGLLIASESNERLADSAVVRSVYDPACGTGGMLIAADEYLRERVGSDAIVQLYGQELNDESWAICRSDMLIRGAEKGTVVLGNSFTEDGFTGADPGRPASFDYILANPPYGVNWSQEKDFIKSEHDQKGYDGRFGAGLPRINDGSLLFLQHMVSKMVPVSDDGTGGSRVAVVFSGSPLFAGDAGSGESDIRRWVIENDWLEAIVALPDQMFYNTGIATYVWVLTNRKEARRRGKVQLIDARQMYTKMSRGIGDKRRELSRGQIDDLLAIHSSFTHDETRPMTDQDPVTHQDRVRDLPVSKIYDNSDFGYQKIAVQRPLRLRFDTSPDRVQALRDTGQFSKLSDEARLAVESYLASPPPERSTITV